MSSSDGSSPRVSPAVQTFVVVEHEALDALVEAPELVQQLATTLRMELDDGVFVLKPLQDRGRHRELADVVEQAADRKAPQASRRQAELLPDLHA